MHDINDLYHKATRGNEASEGRLFRHLTEIFGIIVSHKGRGRIDAEDQDDIVQNAVTKVARAYRETTFSTSFAAWAHTILKHEFLNHCKRQSVRAKYMVPIMTDRQDVDVEEPDSELRTRLMECFRKLHLTKPIHARIINLHYQGYSTSEICGRMGITANSLHVSLHRARTKLRVCLDAKEDANE